jgi:hypothetical protein
LFGRLVPGVLHKLGHQRKGETIGGDEFGFQNGMIIEGLSVAGTGETTGTVTAAEADCARSIDGHNEIDSK